jgi:hypothetical protein
MIEVRVHDEVLGDVLVCFDGRVLEIFGHGPVTPSRFHVGMLIMAVEEADRKGRHQIDFAPARAGRNGVRLVLADREREAIEPLIVELRQALDALGS